MKRILLDEIAAKYRLESYHSLYEKVLSLIDSKTIKPLKASGTNGKKPALYKEYWLMEAQEDNSSHLEELSYLYVPMISTDYYLHHLKQYQEDRPWLLLLNQYLKDHRQGLSTPQSINERSFAIWHREKFLKEEQGKKILKRCGITLEMLNLYETTEPLACYVHTRKTPQNMVILENKDTFYTMRKHLLSGNSQILGIAVGTLIYGAGKGIHRSFSDFSLCGEPYMREKGNRIYYFGDLDFEGILIYEKLASLFQGDCTIEPFCQAYEKMLEKAEEIGTEHLPAMKTGQNQNIANWFWEFFETDMADKMKYILHQGRYIPQEILALQDLS